MAPSRKKVFIWIIAALFVLGVVGCGLFVKAAATVDGEKITIKQLEMEVSRVAAEHPTAAGKGSFPKESRESRLKALDFLINDVIYRREAEKLGIKVTDKEVEAEVNRTRKQFPSEADFETYVKNMGITLSYFRESTRNRLIRRAVQDKITTKVKVTDKELKDFYEANKKLFTSQPERVRIGLIQLKSEKEARDALAKIKKGMDFDEAGARFSINPSVKKRGFQAIWVTHGSLASLSPQLAELTFSLTPGQVGEPIQTPIGWVVIKIYEKKVATQGSFEEVRSDIEPVLKTQKWLKEARKKVNIKIYL